MEDLLECSVCLDPYQANGLKTPKVLPCQHSYCVECLRNLSTGYSVTCPACRSKHYTRRVDDLPNSFLLLQLLDCRRTDDDAKKCQECQQQSNQIKVLCESCFDEHVENQVIHAICAATSVVKEIRPGLLSKSIGVQCDLEHMDTVVEPVRRRYGTRAPVINQWTKWMAALLFILKLLFLLAIFYVIMIAFVKFSFHCKDFFSEVYFLIFDMINLCWVSMSGGVTKSVTFFKDILPNVALPEISVYDLLSSASCLITNAIKGVWSFVVGGCISFSNGVLSVCSAVTSFLYSSFGAFSNNIGTYSPKVHEVAVNAISSIRSSVAAVPGNIYSGVADNAPVVYDSGMNALSSLWVGVCEVLYFISATLTLIMTVYIPAFWTCVLGALAQVCSAVAGVLWSLCTAVAYLSATYSPQFYDAVIYILLLMYEALTTVFYFLYDFILSAVTTYAPKVCYALYNALSSLAAVASSIGSYFLGCVLYAVGAILSSIWAASAYMAAALCQLFLNQLGSAFEWLSES